jgi:hypothetical protein
MLSEVWHHRWLMYHIYPVDPIPVDSTCLG